MKRITATTSSFRKLIKENFVYVDKTSILYDLITRDRYYFLARPRRFGKTLFISTLEQLFLGNRELFKGLWIDSSDYSWEKHPVISLNFSTLASRSPEELKHSLGVKLDSLAKENSIDLSASSNAGDKISLFVQELAKINNVVILIDEYDFPLINNIRNPEVMQANLDILKDFFTVIKGLDDSLRAFFITGVSQIPTASLFSGLNNLNNISLDPVAATLLGYTKEEVITYFTPYIERLADTNNQSPKEIEEAIRVWYNGYRFSNKDVKVYNPFSLHYLFTKKEFNNYWFNSGSPTFLLEILKKNHSILESIGNPTSTYNSLQSITLENPELVPLLFQTGYLTIASYDQEEDYYTLAYPNQEVQQSYTLALIGSLTDKKENEIDSLKRLMRQALLTNNITAFCTSLSSMFARIPYQLAEKTEASYHTALCFIMEFVGFSTQCEVSTNKGRVDMVISTPKFIYILEFKINATAEKALNHIEERTYYEPYLGGKETIVLVGLAFNRKDGEATITCATKTLT